MKNAANDASQTQRTATSAYAAARNDIARLLDVLDMELAKHDERAKADAKNWGFAGNLQKLRCDLVDAVAFIAGMDRNEVEAFLDDAA
ncbi:MAG: hypothetical protein KF768_11460 [Phycisphaeraceae bacterium]|nr:hypothetical protein [Phycisphaeraceae bacterium]